MSSFVKPKSETYSSSSNCQSVSKEPEDQAANIVLQKKDNYIKKNKINPYLCRNCLEVFTDPYVVTCGHSFCYACINNPSQPLKNCKVCKKGLIPGDIIENKVLYNLVLEYEKLNGVVYDRIYYRIQNVNLSDLDIILKFKNSKELFKNLPKISKPILRYYLLYKLHQRAQKKSTDLDQDLINLKIDSKSFEDVLSDIKNKCLNLKDLKLFFDNDMNHSIDLQNESMLLYKYLKS